MAAISPLTVTPFSAAPKDLDRLNEAATVFTEIMEAPDKGIPQNLLEAAHCIVIVPGVTKGAFIVGAKYGKGFLSCREKTRRNWSAPAAVRVEGGSVGFQIGGSETDAIFLVMNVSGGDWSLSSPFTLGGEGDVAAGPVGRSANALTDAKFTADILSWSRARGVVAGISLQGSALRQDLGVNKALYGRRLENREIVDKSHSAPRGGGALALPAEPLLTAGEVNLHPGPQAPSAAKTLLRQFQASVHIAVRINSEKLRLLRRLGAP